MAKLKTGFQDVEIGKLVKADWNYKKEDPKLTQKLTENIKRNGFIENIIIRRLDTGFYEVVNGNHRLEVASRLNMETIHCYNLGDISESKAKKIAIAGNETRFETDEIKLSETLKELAEAFSSEDLSLELPYSEEQLRARIEMLEYDWGGGGGDEEETSENSKESKKDYDEDGGYESEENNIKEGQPHKKESIPVGYVEYRAKIPLDCLEGVIQLFKEMELISKKQVEVYEGIVEVLLSKVLEIKKSDDFPQEPEIEEIEF